MGHGTCRLISYADLPYAITTPQLVNDKIAEIQDTGLRVQEFRPPMGRDRASMTRAVDRYESQAEQLAVPHPDWRDCLRKDAERFFRN